MQSTNDYRSRARQNNPYAQQDDNPSYAAAPVVPSTTNLTAGGNDMTSFYSEVRPYGVVHKIGGQTLTLYPHHADLIHPG